MSDFLDAIHGEKRGMEKDGKIHGNRSLLEVVEVVMDILVDWRGPVRAQLPDAS